MNAETRNGEDICEICPSPSWRETFFLIAATLQ